MKKHIPNIITLFNLFFGACALVAVLNAEFLVAFYFLVAAGLADLADGLIARALGVHSELGKQLDSLADMISFGLVPGMILYVLLVSGNEQSVFENGIVFSALPVFILPVFSALRLGKFNIDKRQTEDFIGLATPASAIFVVGLMLIRHFNSFGFGEWVSSPWLIYSSALVLSILLLVEIPMFSLKFKRENRTRTQLQLAFLILSLLFLAFFKEAAFSLIIIFYVLINIIRLAFKRKH